jgi:tRNA dimethylallyltransferase
MKGVPHFLLDVAEPGEFFSLKEYQELAYKAIDDIILRGRQPFLVGGTGLYVNAVADGYELSDAPVDAELRSKVEAMSLKELQVLVSEKLDTVPDTLDMKNKRRLERAAEKILQGKPLNLESVKRYETLCLGVTWEREKLYKRIEERLDRRLDEGMIEEVAGLMERGVSDDFLYRLGLEYRYIMLYLRGRFKDREEFRAKLFMEIRHLAKEQMTWFRKRKDVHWLNMEADPMEEAGKLIDTFLK